MELNATLQDQIDSLKLVQANEQPRSTTVNPNYLSDYRGYLMGMSPAEIDRLHQFRNNGMYVRSPEEFQKVTGISDSLFKTISPILRLPKLKKTYFGNRAGKKRTIIKKDLNTATATELEAIYGIGKVLSKRIIKFRNALGGFIDERQLYDVYGLEEEVVRRVFNSYEIIKIPEIKRYSINGATAAELASSVYLSWDVAREIVAYRDSVGGVTKWEEIATIQGFPIDKIERIKLYLTL